jgi:SAM-dependent methyltransferase
MTTVYDEIPYANLPFAQARPSVFATVAALHGLTPPDPRSARVLELGCGAGANLAGIAAANPEVTAVGVDLAASAIADGRETAAAAGLGNLRFEVGDVLALTAGELGEFDYVIAHGLYSWVEAPAREATLAACRSHLSADGIAYVSYTAHPGGHLRRMLREAAEWHARGLDDRVERAERSRHLFGLLDGLEQSDGPSFYGGVLAEDLRALATAPEQMLVHDLLSADYEPVWFKDFAAAASRHGMTYVGDALPASSRRPAWSEGVDAFVDDAAGEDRIAREQYFDLLVLRRFRHSLLCRDERRPSREVDRAAVQRMLVAENGEAPVPFETLRERRSADAGELAETLVSGFDEGNVSFRAVPSPAARVAGERPVASALARSQARPGAIVTTLENHVVRLNDEPTAALLGLLDGTRDRTAIRDEFPGELTEESLEAALAKLAELGLLVA